MDSILYSNSIMQLKSLRMPRISIRWMLPHGEKTPPKATFEERLRIYQREADQQHTQRNYHSRDKGAR